jgi:hypothetical protein
MCDLECTDLAWGRITFYGDGFGGGSDCDVCGDDIIVVYSNNNLLTANHVLCEFEWLVFLHFSWFMI